MVVFVVQFHEAHTIEIDSIYAKYAKISMFYKCNIILHMTVVLHGVLHYKGRWASAVIICILSCSQITAFSQLIN